MAPIPVPVLERRQKLSGKVSKGPIENSPSRENPKATVKTLFQLAEEGAARQFNEEIGGVFSSLADAGSSEEVDLILKNLKERCSGSVEFFTKVKSSGWLERVFSACIAKRSLRSDSLCWVCENLKTDELGHLLTDFLNFCIRVLEEGSLARLEEVVLKHLACISVPDGHFGGMFGLLELLCHAAVEGGTAAHFCALENISFSLLNNARIIETISKFGNRIMRFLVRRQAYFSFRLLINLSGTPLLANELIKSCEDDVLEQFISDFIPYVSLVLTKNEADTNSSVLGCGVLTNLAEYSPAFRGKLTSSEQFGRLVDLFVEKCSAGAKEVYLHGCVAVLIAVSALPKERISPALIQKALLRFAEYNLANGNNFLLWNRSFKELLRSYS